MIPTAKSYFSGAGLMDLGLCRAGINVVQSLEIDSVCVDTLKKNFSHNILSCDIKDKTVLSQPKTDIIVGTYPCTKYSTIADIHGTRTGDELYLHFFRHIAIERPEAYVVENVPGMKKFPNYYVNVFCPVDALNWLPQKRNRLILIGTKKRVFIHPPERTRRILLSEIFEEYPDMKVPDYVKKRLSGKYRDLPIISDPKDPYSVAPTCVAHYSKDQSTRLIKDRSHPLGVRPYTVKEYARLQGVPDDFQFTGSESEAYKMIGNGVAVPMAEWIGNELMKYFN
jgi:DNA (cytosine-5)-methyltransferase 1